MAVRRSDTENEQMIRNLIEEGVLKDSLIIQAFRKVRRREFALPEQRAYAYLNTVLPSKGGATMSQPYAVAAMLEELAPRQGERILEIGTGSGYNACLICKCVGSKGRVVSIEIDHEAAEFARKNVGKERPNITLLEGDGSEGYQKMAPYDGIIYTCAIPKIPEEAVSQLKIGGRLVAPVGDYLQVLSSITKVSESETSKRELGHYLFVPLRKR